MMLLDIRPTVNDDGRQREDDAAVPLHVSLDVARPDLALGRIGPLLQGENSKVP